MEIGDTARHDRGVSRGEDSSEPVGDVQRRTHWWRVGYKRLATVLAFLGVVFGLAQLPGKLEGLPGDLKRALNVIDTKTHPDSVLAFDRIGPFRLEPDRSLKAAVAALGKPTAIGTRSGSCFVRWEQHGPAGRRVHRPPALPLPVRRVHWADQQPVVAVGEGDWRVPKRRHRT
jgi:hypothetical protein